jgi:alkylation response protein AidB-like acyl-CoA dehydrogenase
VVVADDELLVTPGPLGSVFASLRPCIAQLVLVNVYLGLAEGAFAEARRLTPTATRPRYAGAPPVTADPYVLHRYGQLYVALEGARLLADRAGEALESAWNRGDALSEAGRGEVALAVATAKVSTTQVGLDVTSQIFDVTSARVAGRTAGLDRYWRNLRVHSLHDPVDYKLRELGDWALNGQIPTPSFYS